MHNKPTINHVLVIADRCLGYLYDTYIVNDSIVSQPEYSLSIILLIDLPI